MGNRVSGAEPSFRNSENGLPVSKYTPKALSILRESVSDIFSELTGSIFCNFL